MSTPIQPAKIHLERNEFDKSLFFKVEQPWAGTPKIYRRFKDVVSAHPTAVLPADAVHRIVEDALRKTGRI